MTSPDLGIEDPGPTSAPARRRRSPVVLRVLVGALAVLLLLGVLAVGYLGFRLGHINDEPFNPFSGAADVPSDRDRARAEAVAEQFTLRMDNIDYAHMDTYFKRVNELLTTKAKADNDKIAPQVKQAYATAKLKGTGKVLLTGLADIDDDSASVLVIHNATVTSTQNNDVHNFRWTVDLVKVKGRWLVDSFTRQN